MFIKKLVKIILRFPVKIILKPIVKKIIYDEASAFWCNLLANPHLINLYMQIMFTYKKDIDRFNKPDYWQTPQEMFINEEGDCEDYSFFAQKLLLSKFDSAYVLAIITTKPYTSIDPDVGHAICIFIEKNKFRYIDNGGLHRSFLNENEIIRNVIDTLYSNYKLKQIYVMYLKDKKV